MSHREHSLLADHAEKRLERLRDLLDILRSAPPGPNSGPFELLPSSKRERQAMGAVLGDLPVLRELWPGVGSWSERAPPEVRVVDEEAAAQEVNRYDPGLDGLATVRKFGAFTDHDGIIYLTNARVRLMNPALTDEVIAYEYEARVVGTLGEEARQDWAQLLRRKIHEAERVELLARAQLDLAIAHELQLPAVPNGLSWTEEAALRAILPAIRPRWFLSLPGSLEPDRVVAVVSGAELAERLIGYYATRPDAELTNGLATVRKLADGAMSGYRTDEWLAGLGHELVDRLIMTGVLRPGASPDAAAPRPARPYQLPASHLDQLTKMLPRLGPNYLRPLEEASGLRLSRVPGAPLVLVLHPSAEWKLPAGVDEVLHRTLYVDWLDERGHGAVVIAHRTAERIEAHQVAGRLDNSPDPARNWWLRFLDPGLHPYQEGQLDEAAAARLRQLYAELHWADQMATVQAAYRIHHAARLAAAGANAEPDLRFADAVLHSHWLDADDVGLLRESWAVTVPGRRRIHRASWLRGSAGC